MQTITINGQEYKYEAIFVTKKAVNGNIGVIVQLQVFKDGEYLDKKYFNGYVAEKIEEHIMELI